MRPREIAMPPSSMMRRVWSIVTMVPPSTSRSTVSRRFCAAASERGSSIIVINSATVRRSFNINKLVGCFLSFQEPGIKRARQQFGDMKNFTLPGEIRKDDLRAASKLPDDLAASATRRRQCFGIRHYRESRKLPLTLTQG